MASDRSGSTATQQSGLVSHDAEEFSFLTGQAERLGTAVPNVERIDVTSSEGAVASAIAYGDAPAEIVFLHGAGLNAHTWDATVLSLGEPALAIDLPGHGDSAWRQDADYSPHTMAPAVIGVIEAAASSPVVLVGQSLGGLTAAAIAAARPDLVSRLILVDITPAVDQGGPERLRAFYERLEFSSREELVDRAVSFGLGGDRIETRRGVHLNSRVREDGVVEWKHHFATIAARALDASSSARAVDAAASWRDLETVRADTTLVRGTHGFVDESAADVFSERIPAASIVTVDAPHNVQEVAPRELADVIRKAHS
ncbi:alpha/beta fold hydrolase [Microbacterium halotolerans]|uniref:alpha/beta fold hydrolase n=1 Tax=Microbacterium halotolerans TaxID=246613 RepID=UPI001F08EBCF|nr:alpha/beta hydrolase [Microbacterium halotolerans]